VKSDDAITSKTVTFLIYIGYKNIAHHQNPKRFLLKFAFFWQ